MKEPTWINRLTADAIHFEQLKQHGGTPGIRDENALESALGRPKNKRVYEDDSDLALLAAAYGYGLAMNHGYSDGNKRTAFLVMYTFLGVNGWELDAAEVEVVALMLDVANHRCGEAGLAAWIRTRLSPFAD